MILHYFYHKINNNKKIFKLRKDNKQRNRRNWQYILIDIFQIHTEHILAIVLIDCTLKLNATNLQYVVSSFSPFVNCFNKTTQITPPVDMRLAIDVETHCQGNW